MTRFKRRLFFLAAGVFISAVFFIVVLSVMPCFINTESIKSTVEAQLSDNLGAQISYRRADLFFLPRPGVIFHDGTVIFRDRMRGSFGSLDVRLNIIPLLRGGISASALRITAPKVSIRLERTKEANIPTLEELRGKLKQLLKTLGEKAPDLGVVMRNGNLTLLEGDQAVFLFTGLDADIVFPPRGPKIRITGSSNFARAMTVLLQVDQNSLSGKGEIDLRQVRMQPLFGYFMPHGPVEVRGSGMDLSMLFRTAGMQMVEGEVSSSLSDLTLKRKGRELTIRGDKLKGAFRIRDGKVEASLRELELSYPRLLLEGTLLADRSAGQISLNIEGRGIDVRSTRKAASSFAGDIPIVQSIFGYVRNGTIPGITVSSQAASAAELGDSENIRIKGRIEKGEVFVEGPQLDFRNVSGNCVIINGMLHGTGIDAVLNKSRLQNGTLRVGLKGAVVPLGLDTRVSVDLTTLQSILLRLLKNEAVVHEISLMKKVKGRALGRLIISGDSASPTVVADVREVALSADYQRIPYPVSILQGQVFYDGNHVAAKNLWGAIGGSSFSGLTASLELKEAFSLGIASGSLDLSLPEVHPWLASYETLRPALQQISSVKGALSISSVQVKGPLFSPDKWHFRIGGSGRDIAFTSCSLPGSVRVAKADIDATETKLAVSGAEVRMLDSAVDLSGDLTGYMKDIQTLDLRLKGSIGPESFRWISDTLGFPSTLRKSLQLAVSSAHVAWECDGKTAFSGALKVAEGPKISVDIARDASRLTVKRLLIEDSSSRAGISLALDAHKLGLSFSGKLTGKTAESMVDTDGHSRGWISGDFRAEVSLDRPVKSAATGKVAADGFVIPWGKAALLEIDGLSVEGLGERIRLDSCDLRWGDDRISLRGDLTSSEKGVSFDLDASAAIIDAGSIMKKLEEIGNERKKQGKGGIPAPSAAGTVRVRAGQLRHGKIALVPFGAKISLDDRKLGIDVSEATFCGVSLPGRMNLANGEISLDFRPSARAGSLEATLSCLSHSFDLNEYATGTFDLSGKITGKGGKKDMVRWMEGDIDFTARDGRIYNEPSILKILAFLEVTQIAKGYGDAWRKGLSYDEVRLKGRIRHGKIEIEEGALDSSYMKMASQGDIDPVEGKLDVKVLVSPLRTVDRILEKIPVLGRVLGGTLLSIPVRVSGDIKDPQVSPFSFSSADAGLLGIMEKTLTLPFKVFTPFVPDKKDGAKERRENAK